MRIKVIVNQIKDGLLYSSLVIVAMSLIRGITTWFQVVSVLLMGIIIALTNLLYQNENLSTRTVLIIHYIVTTSTIFSLNALNHWVPTTTSALLAEWLSISAIYLFVWLASNYLTRRWVRRVNAHLAEIQDKKR